MSRIVRSALIVVTALVMNGCEVGPNYKTPEPDVADRFDARSLVLPTRVEVTVASSEHAVTLLPRGSIWVRWTS